MAKTVLSRTQERDLASIRGALLQARLYARSADLKFISYLVEMALSEVEEIQMERRTST